MHEICRASLALNLYAYEYSWAQAQPVLAMFALLDDSGDDLKLAEVCGEATDRACEKGGEAAGGAQDKVTQTEERLA